MLHKTISNMLILGLGGVALAVLLVAVGTVMNGEAAVAPGLGAASSYAVLGGQTVTNTGPTTINGDVGVSPGSAVTGFFPPGIVTGGTIHSADANAGQAQSDLTTAYNAVAAEPCTADLTGQDLGGMTLTEGVYCFSSSAQLTGLLILDAQGNPNAAFNFKTVSTLTTASNAVVQVINGGVDCNAFWQIGSSATLGTGTQFVGNILALTSITLDTGASISGRALARNGSVTLDTNNVDFLACAATATPSATASPTASATDTPTPAATDTPTPAPTDTPTPTPTGSPSPIPTDTPTPTPTGSPSPIPTPVLPTPSPTPVIQTPTPTPPPTNTPSPTTPVVPRFPPNTGGPSSQGGVPWIPLLLGLAIGSLAATAFVLSLRGQHPHFSSRRVIE